MKSIKLSAFIICIIQDLVAQNIQITKAENPSEPTIGRIRAIISKIYALFSLQPHGPSFKNCQVLLDADALKSRTVFIIKD